MHNICKNKTLRFLLDFASSLKDILLSIFGNVFILPIALMVPRNKKRVTVIGRYGGEFADNAKYFFLDASDYKELEIVFVSEKHNVVQALKSAGVRSEIYPSYKSIFFMMTSSVVVVDNNQWRSKFKRHVVRGAKLVQLWHGVGFKRIENDKIFNESNNKPWLQYPLARKLRKFTRVISGRNITYDLVVTTSKFYEENVFRSAISSRHYLIAGYSRNTFGLSLLKQEALWVGVDKEMYDRCVSWRFENKKVIFVLPTFRDSRKEASLFSHGKAEVINKFCVDHNIELVFKLHPFDNNKGNICGSNFHIINPSSDIYPLLPLATALITDYSSIYSDFIFTGRPIIFFWPDIEKYIKNERQIQFNYNDMTPGPKLKSWEDVLGFIAGLDETDNWFLEREKFLNLAFDGLDQKQVTSKIIQFLKGQEWLI